MKKTAPVILFLLHVAMAVAQQKEKGGSPDSKWSNEPESGFIKNSADSNNLYTQLRFGKWAFRSVYSKPASWAVSVNKDDPPKTIVGRMIGNTRAASANIINYHHAIEVNCTTPAGNKYRICFSLHDSLRESWLETQSRPMSEQPAEIREPGIRHLKKVAQGQVIKGVNDSLAFLVQVDHDLVNSVKGFCLLGNGDSILLSPAESPSPESRYGGVEFYFKGKIIGAAIKKQAGTYSRYRYWFRLDEKEEMQQAIASMIFVVVAFID